MDIFKNINLIFRQEVLEKLNLEIATSFLLPLQRKIHSGLYRRRYIEYPLLYNKYGEISNFEVETL